VREQRREWVKMVARVTENKGIKPMRNSDLRSCKLPWHTKKIIPYRFTIAVVLALPWLGACGGSLPPADDPSVPTPARPSTTSEPPSEEQAASRFVSGVAQSILKCFHPSQKLVRGSVDHVEHEGSQRTITTTLVMQGILSTYAMQVKVELDHPTDRIRVTPIRENTMLPANPDCPLRNWTNIRDVDEAAVEAVSAFRTQVVVGVAAAVAVLGRHDAEDRLPKCLSEAFLDKTVETVVEGSVSTTAQRAIVSAAIKQAYADNPSATGVASQALSYAVIDHIRGDNPKLADALDAASLAMCLARSR
jgi:hypothetical protein